MFSNGQWIYDANLGNCDMKIAVKNFDRPDKNLLDQEHLVFQFLLKTTQDEIQISDGLRISSGVLGAEVSFECRYMASLTVGERDLIVQSATASDSLTFAYGDLLKVLTYPPIGTFVNWHIPELAYPLIVTSIFKNFLIFFNSGIQPRSLRR